MNISTHIFRIRLNCPKEREELQAVLTAAAQFLKSQVSIEELVEIRTEDPLMAGILEEISRSQAICHAEHQLAAPALEAGPAAQSEAALSPTTVPAAAPVDAPAHARATKGKPRERKHFDPRPCEICKEPFTPWREDQTICGKQDCKRKRGTQRWRESEARKKRKNQIPEFPAGAKYYDADERDFLTQAEAQTRLTYGRLRAGKVLIGEDGTQYEVQSGPGFKYQLVRREAKA